MLTILTYGVRALFLQYDFKFRTFGRLIESDPSPFIGQTIRKKPLFLPIRIDTHHSAMAKIELAFINRLAPRKDYGKHEKCEVGGEIAP
jgi:hypothetical protein